MIDHQYQTNLDNGLKQDICFKNGFIYDRSIKLTENGLILDFKAHGVVRALGDGKDVGRDLIPPLASVHPNCPLENVDH